MRPYCEVLLFLSDLSANRNHFDVLVHAVILTCLACHIQVARPCQSPRAVLWGGVALPHWSHAAGMLFITPQGEPATKRIYFINKGTSSLPLFSIKTCCYKTLLSPRLRSTEVRAQTNLIYCALTLIKQT